jgi:phospholipase/lecithinase/hemolysin
MNTRKAPVATLLAGLVLALNATAVVADGPGRVVVFGDSLSDAGNHYLYFGESAAEPFEPIPSASYDIGGHHFSNVATWVEQLSRELSVPQTARASMSRSNPGSNYAFGQARARANAAEFPIFDFASQVGSFLTDVNGQAPDDALYVVWIGANDVRDGISTILMAHLLGGDPVAAQAAAGQILSEAGQATLNGILTLYFAGARDFLIVNVPSPGYTPALAMFGALAQGVANQVTGGYNAGLANMVAGLSGLPGATFTQLDADGVIAGIFADPEAAGFENVFSPCLAFGQFENSICDAPDRHLFWDAVHPTRGGHRVMAAAAAEVLGAD